MPVNELDWSQVSTRPDLNWYHAPGRTFKLNGSDSSDRPKIQETQITKIIKKVQTQILEKCMDGRALNYCGSRGTVKPLAAAAWNAALIRMRRIPII